MAAGGDVKETVMTILFLRTYIINMIADLEKRFTSDGNKQMALAQPEAPWKWFSSYLASPWYRTSMTDQCTLL